MIKLVAFDWNGTIFADTYAALESEYKVFKFLKLKPLTLKEFQKHYDVPVKKLFIAVGMPENSVDRQVQKITDIFHLEYEAKAIKIRIRANTRYLLKWLLKQGISRVIFSNHTGGRIEIQLQRLKIQQLFSAVLANTHLDSAFKGRNKKATLRNFIRAKGLNAREVLVIGDTIEEIEIGQELDTHTVALTGGCCSRARLKEAKPDFLISNLKEVIDIIKQLNQ